MAISDNGRDSWKRGKFCGSALGVTARSDDPGMGIESMCATDIGTRFAISFGSDAAGIDDHHIGCADSILRGAVGTQEGGYGLAIGARRAATKVLDVEGRGHKGQFIGVQ